MDERLEDYILSAKMSDEVDFLTEKDIEDKELALDVCNMLSKVCLCYGYKEYSPMYILSKKLYNYIDRECK